VLTALTAILAIGVAAGYFAIALLILPRIQLRDATPRFAGLFRWGATAFFVGCGLTHTHIAVHAINGSQDASWHEVLFHLLQVFGVWTFVVVALRIVDVQIIRRKTPQEVEAERLERQVADLSRSNTDLERFAHVVSHDLQEPLRSVSGFADLLAMRSEGRLDERGRESLGFIRDGVRRMGAMLDGVLDYSRAAGVGLSRQRVDMNAVVRDAEADLSRAIADRDAAITVGELPEVEGDAVQLRQLVTNLLANALKFSGERPPRVEVSAEVTDAGWTFAVRDEGIGIDPRDAERIFTMFARAHPDGTGAGHAEGTGIGLAVCRRIVERHGGEIWVESTPGGGSTFRFTLPRTLAASAPLEPAGGAVRAG
jgi:signal transduction histidine kinase